MKSKQEVYTKPEIGTYRARPTLMENYSRKPGHLSRKRENVEDDAFLDSDSPYWKQTGR